MKILTWPLVSGVLVLILVHQIQTIQKVGKGRSLQYQKGDSSSESSSKSSENKNGKGGIFGGFHKLTYQTDRHKHHFGNHHSFTHRLTKNKTATDEVAKHTSHNLGTGVHASEKLEIIKSAIDTGGKDANHLFKIPTISTSDDFLHKIKPKIKKLKKNSIWGTYLWPTPTDGDHDHKHHPNSKSDEGPQSRSHEYLKWPKSPKFDPKSPKDSNSKGKSEESSRSDEKWKTGGPKNPRHGGSDESSDHPKTGGPGGPKPKIWGSYENLKTRGPNDRGPYEDVTPKIGGPEGPKKWNKEDLNDEVPSQVDNDPETGGPKNKNGGNSREKSPESESGSEEIQQRSRKQKKKPPPKVVPDYDHEVPIKRKKTLTKKSEESPESAESSPEEKPSKIPKKSAESPESSESSPEEKKPKIPKIKKNKKSKILKLHPEATDPFNTIFPKNTKKVIPDTKLLYAIEDTSPEDTSLEDWFASLMKNRGNRRPPTTPEPHRQAPTSSENRKHEPEPERTTTTTTTTTEAPPKHEIEAPKHVEPEATEPPPPKHVEEITKPQIHEKNTTPFSWSKETADSSEEKGKKPKKPSDSSNEGPANPIAPPSRVMESAPDVTDITEPPVAKIQETTPIPVTASTRKPKKNVWLRFKERETEPPSAEETSTPEGLMKRSRVRPTESTTASPPESTTGAAVHEQATTHGPAETTLAPPPTTEAPVDPDDLGSKPEEGSCDKHALTPSGDEDEDDIERGSVAEGYGGASTEGSAGVWDNEINFRPPPRISGSGVDEPKFEDVLPKFKIYKDKLTKLITRMVPQCPEIHGLRLLRVWMRMFRHAFPNFVAMTLESMKYSKDLKLQLGACFERLVNSDFGYSKSHPSKSDVLKMEEEDGSPKFKRSIVDVSLLTGSFQSEVSTPLLNFFVNMPQLVQSAVSDLTR